MTQKEKLEKATILALQGKLFESKYDFNSRNNIIELLNSLSYKEILDFYKQFYKANGEGTGRESKRQFLIDLVKNTEDIKEFRNNLLDWYSYKMPYQIYHFTTLEKTVSIIKDKKLYTNEENLICCSGKNNLMDFENNSNIVRFNIKTTQLPPFLLVRRRDKDDKNNVEFEDEWVIDFSNVKYNYLSVEDISITIDYSPALAQDTEINKMLKQKYNL